MSAVPPPSDPEPTAAALPVLLFRVAGQTLAIRRAEVAEVLPLPRLTRLPEAPPILRGAFHLGADLVLVLPIAELLGLIGPAEGTPLYHHLLLIPGRDQRMRLAFLVDRVLDITEAEHQPVPAVTSFNNCVEGDVRQAGALIPLVALPRLLAAHEEARLAAFAARAAARLAAFALPGEAGG